MCKLSQCVCAFNSLTSNVLIVCCIVELVTEAESRKILIGEDPKFDDTPSHVRSYQDTFVMI